MERCKNPNLLDFGSPEGAFLTFFGRTDLRKGVSRAKLREEFDFEVRLAVAPQNLGKNVEKRCATAKKFANEKFLTSKNEMSGIV